MGRTLGQRSYIHNFRKGFIRYMNNSQYFTERQKAKLIQQEFARYPLKSLLHKGRKP